MMLCLLGLIYVLLSRVSRELTVLQMRSDFLRTTSHELKTPLTLISIFSENLITNPDLSGEERLNCYQVIHRESCRLNNLARNLLHVAPIPRENEEIILSEGNLADVVDKTTKICSLWLGRHGFTVRTEIASALPPVRFDQEKVAQALMIVFDNARKYSGLSRTIDVRLWEQGSSVNLEVQDYGIGIPEKEKERIFDERYRASNVKGQLGLGLGLFLASEIMRAHHGTIEVDSEAGRGSRFRMIFPAAVKILTDEADFAVSPDGR